MSPGNQRMYLRVQVYTKFQIPTDILNIKISAFSFWQSKKFLIEICTDAQQETPPHSGLLLDKHVNNT